MNILYLGLYNVLGTNCTQKIEWLIFCCISSQFTQNLRNRLSEGGLAHIATAPVVMQHALSGVSFGFGGRSVKKRQQLEKRGSMRLFLLCVCGEGRYFTAKVICCLATESEHPRATSAEICCSRADVCATVKAFVFQQYISCGFLFPASLVFSFFTKKK